VPENRRKRPGRLGVLSCGAVVFAATALVGARQARAAARVPTCFGRPATTTGTSGTPGADVIIGTAGADVIAEDGGAIATGDHSASGGTAVGSGNDRIAGSSTSVTVPWGTPPGRPPGET
jgi:hypothetical protein